MLRINLLPPYIYDDLKRRNYMFVGGAICVAVIVGCGFWWMTAKGVQEEAQKRNEEAKTQKEKYDAEVAAIEKVKQGAADTQAKSDFVNNSRTFNDSWAKVYEDVRAMTAPKVVLNSMRLTSASNVELQGFAPNELEVARWWMELRKSPYFAQVQFDLPAHPYPPTGGGATGGGAAMAMGGGGGMSGGGGQAAMMQAMMSGGRGSGGFASMGGGGFGGGGGAARSNANVGPTELEGRPGISFVGHLVLAKPLADGKPAPAWGNASRGGGGGGGGMSGGISGGSQGAMMSMMMGGGGGGGTRGSSPPAATSGGGGKGKAGAED